MGTSPLLLLQAFVVRNGAHCRTRKRRQGHGWLAVANPSQRTCPTQLGRLSWPCIPCAAGPCPPIARTRYLCKPSFTGLDLAPLRTPLRSVISPQGVLSKLSAAKEMMREFLEREKRKQVSGLAA